MGAAQNIVFVPYHIETIIPDPKLISPENKHPQSMANLSKYHSSGIIITK